MSGHRYGSASSGSDDPPMTSQASMKAAILDELKGATFTVDLTAPGAPLQATSDDVQKVFDYLGVTHVTLFTGGHSRMDEIPQFPAPRKGFTKEVDSYDPVARFLNTIIRVANNCLGGPRYLEKLHFDRHEAEMQDKVNSERPLMPDILGLLCPRKDKKKYSWVDVMTFIEVKDQEIDAVRQLATYARSHLALDRRRSFSIAIYFNHHKMLFTFCCFHRSGVSASPQLNLDDEDGFKGVVKYMVGILSIRDEAAFGLDMTRDKNVCRLNDRDYNIVRTIQSRPSIRGHATVVYILERGLDKPASLPSRKLTDAGSERVSELPNRMVYKLSYQPKERPSEGTLFSKSRGQFGVIDIVGDHICSKEDIFGSTECYTSNAETWSLLGNKKEDTGKNKSPEIRYLHCTAMALEGLPLLDSLKPSDIKDNLPTPHVLVETILHAIIGHYNLFRGGILHRDVSYGNILRLQEPIMRQLGHSKDLLARIHNQSVDFQGVDFTHCRGILIDGDHAIKWRQGEEGPSTERSGTLPFMSSHLLTAWSLRDPALHTAADDLESFLWVLVWSLVCTFKAVTNITNSNARILQLERVFSGHTIETSQRDLITGHRWTDMVFRGLIGDWFALALNSRTVVLSLEGKLLSKSDDENKILDELDKHCEEVYESFIRTGYKHLETIRKVSGWGEVVDRNGNSLNT